MTMKRTAAASLGAIGVVFGDIGTSPLYTLQVAGEVHAQHALSRADVFGVVSLVLWALFLAISFKYVACVMWADNRGEGGILALLSLLPESTRIRKSRAPSLVAILVIAGASLLFGDGMITPAISVLSAFEGLERAEPGLAPYAVPLTCLALFGLFALQRRGPGTVGKLFGPVMTLWFVTVALLGLKELVRYPAMLGALSPVHGFRYFVHHGFSGLRILGVVVLAITGGEALYADMGYFGRRPIRLAWFGLVLPALALSYAGQGALILREPATLARPFFSMVPPGAPAYALVVLAAVATAIASQALISGVFALTTQAMRLGYFPRVSVIHTSREEEEHVYLPLMNWGLMFACVALVLGFRHSERLAAAYGIAVSGTMAITSIVFFQVTRATWKWPAWRSIALLLLFLSFDLPFVGANALKFLDGGYIPVIVAIFFFIVMLDWHAGREALRRRLETSATSFPRLFELLGSGNVMRVPGTSVFLTAMSGVPAPLLLQVERAHSLSEQVVLLTVVTAHSPRVDDASRAEVERLSHGLVRVTLEYGYMEPVVVPRALDAALAGAGIQTKIADATYFAGRESICGGKGGEMRPLAERLFAFLQRNAKSPVDNFQLPPGRVVELGVRLDL
jgi:KUP system potassium uptake protein